jgi:hypothetical protein
MPASGIATLPINTSSFDRWRAIPSSIPEVGIRSEPTTGGRHSKTVAPVISYPKRGLCSPQKNDYNFAVTISSFARLIRVDVHAPSQEGKIRDIRKTVAHNQSAPVQEHRQTETAPRRALAALKTSRFFGVDKGKVRRGEPICRNAHGGWILRKGNPVVRGGLQTEAKDDPELFVPSRGHW